MQKFTPMHNDPKAELDTVNEMIRIESGAEAATLLESEAARTPFALPPQDE